MKELIRSELQNAHPEDISVIRQYVTWLRFRRYVNNSFYHYPRAHWVKVPPHWIISEQRAHWIGSL